MQVEQSCICILLEKDSPWFDVSSFRNQNKTLSPRVIARGVPPVCLVEGGVPFVLSGSRGYLPVLSGRIGALLVLLRGYATVLYQGTPAPDMTYDTTWDRTSDRTRGYPLSPDKTKREDLIHDQWQRHGAPPTPPPRPPWTDTHLWKHHFLSY